MVHVRSAETEALDATVLDAFIGYGLIDMVTFPKDKIKWKLWNPRKVVPKEVEKLITSFKASMNRYRPHNAFPIVVTKSQLIGKQPAPSGFEKPSTLPVFTAADFQGQIYPASGQHRYKAINDFNDEVGDRIVALKTPEPAPGRKKKKDADGEVEVVPLSPKVAAELKKEEEFFAVMGIWLIKIYDRGAWLNAWIMG